jgi:hypothetical protein
VRTDWQRFLQIDVHSVIIDQSTEVVEQHYLRGADSVHLASALSLLPYCTPADTVVMVASDEELLEAATVAGLRVINPMLSIAL